MRGSRIGNVLEDYLPWPLPWPLPPTLPWPELPWLVEPALLWLEPWLFGFLGFCEP